MPKPISAPPRIPNFWRKLGLQAGAVILIVAAVSFILYQAYGAWSLSRMIQEARGHLAKSDYSSAMLAARRIVATHPKNREAAEIAAEAAEKAGSPSALEWRQRVAELDPTDAEAALRWVRSAVKFGRFPIAEVALKAVPESARHSADYFQLAAGVTVGAGKPQDAGRFYAEALRLAPDQKSAQLNYATWVLEFDTDPEKRRLAEASLAQLAAVPEFATRARRSLLNAAVQARQWPAVLAHTDALTQGPDAQPIDWIRRLDALSALKDARLDAELARAQSAATGTPATAPKDPLAVVAILHWLETHGRAEAAVAWSAHLDPKTLADGNVAATLAACLDLLGKWDPLQDLTKTGDWKDKEALRLAYLARARRELGDLAGSSSSWQSATDHARTPEIAEQLVLRTVQWGWRREASELLWKLAAGPHYAWALGALERFYQKDGNTAGLLRVASALAEKDYGNDAAQNNVAALSLLLDRDTERAAKIAASLYAKHPKSLGIASTHALALLKAGKAADALKTFEPFKPEDLRHPAIAATYGPVLAAAGRPEAKEILAIAAKSPLLPEEKALVEKALSGLTAP